MVMPSGIVVCAKNWSNGLKEGLFLLPGIVNIYETSQKLAEQRRDMWLSRISLKDLISHCLKSVRIFPYSDQKIF